MAKIKIMYWKQIPTSITVKESRDNKASRQLPAIFTRTIDQIAMKSDQVSSDDYTAGFHAVKEERDGDPEEIAETILQELIEKHPREWLLQQSREAGVITDE